MESFYAIYEQKNHILTININNKLCYLQLQVDKRQNDKIIDFFLSYFTLPYGVDCYSSSSPHTKKMLIFISQSSEKFVV